MSVRTDIAVLTIKGQVRSILERPTPARNVHQSYLEVRRVNRIALQLALQAADGDATRLRIEDDNTIVVVNQPRRIWGQSVPRARPAMS